MPNHPETVIIEEFGGLNNKNSPERIGENFLAEATNIDIDSSGAIRKRQGYTQLYSGTNIHSLYISSEGVKYFVEETQLKRLEEDHTATVLDSGFQLNQRVDFVELDGRIYFNSLFRNGIIDRDGIVRSWGIDVPAGNSTPVEASNGNLLSGRYQIAITYVSSDGRESGTMTANYVDVANDHSRINLTNIPQSSDPTVSHIRVYCSTPNGEVLYRVKTLAAGTTSAGIYEVNESMVPLSTWFYRSAPKGDVTALYNGRIYIANGNVLWYSEPHGYEWFNYNTNFIPFNAEITNIMPMDDGIFVVADRLYFLEGRGPEDFKLQERDRVKGVKGTSVKIPGHAVIMENIPTGFKYLFTSDQGILLCGTGGLVFNLTEQSVRLDKAEEGAAFFKSDEGINQYVSVLKDPSNNRMKVGDQVQATVVRNGIVI